MKELKKFKGPKKPKEWEWELVYHSEIAVVTARSKEKEEPPIFPLDQICQPEKVLLSNQEIAQPETASQNFPKSGDKVGWEWGFR